MNACPECGSKKLELRKQELLCKRCGLVLSEGMYSGKCMIV